MPTTPDFSGQDLTELIRDSGRHGPYIYRRFTKLFMKICPGTTNVCVQAFDRYVRQQNVAAPVLPTMAELEAMVDTMKGRDGFVARPCLHETMDMLAEERDNGIHKDLCIRDRDDRNQELREINRRQEENIRHQGDILRNQGDIIRQQEERIRHLEVMQAEGEWYRCFWKYVALLINVLFLVSLIFLYIS